MHMTRRFAALTAAALTSAAVAVPALAQGGGGGTTVTFTELDKGSTFRFIDNAPKTKVVRGNPKKISAGDAFVTTAPLADPGGARIGELQAECTATHTTRRFDKAAFICWGDFTFSDGSTMAANVAGLTGQVTRGAILGGTGKYAGARGTFTSTEQSNGNSADVVTLLP